MVKKINKLERDMGPDIVYSEGFKQVLEDHISVIRQDPTTEVVEIDPQVAYANEGDLTAVLDHYNMPMEQHWLIMRVNGLTSPQEYSADITTLLFPSRTTFDSILSGYRTDQKISQKRNK